jgi:hypothetical protein
MPVIKPTPRQEELNALVEIESMLTTTDNPFNPFTEYDEWFAYDVSKGYNTCAYLARIVKSSDELSETAQIFLRGIFWVEQNLY